MVRCAGCESGDFCIFQGVGAVAVFVRDGTEDAIEASLGREGVSMYEYLCG